jgi:hypothetical protein
MELVKRSEIEAKYEKELDYPSGSEELDLYLFETIVKPYYSPSAKPLSMVVGALGEKAARVLKQFHKTAYGIPFENNKVIACNKKNLPGAPFMCDYDNVLSGEMRGDAALEFTWAAPFLEMEEEFRKYDISFVRNPDLVDTGNWGNVFSRALEYTRPEGALVTIVREYDAQRYSNLLKFLGEFDIQPVYSGLTGIINDRPERALLGSNNFHHTIGIFKPRPEQ